MLTRVSLVLQSIIPLHSWEKESPQHMTSDWFIILLAACFTPALTFLVCWNLHNLLCVSVCFSAIGRWCFFSPFPTWLCLNECILCHIYVGCHHCQIVLEVRSNWVEKHSGLQMLMLAIYSTMKDEHKGCYMSVVLILTLFLTLSISLLYVLLTFSLLLSAPFLWTITGFVPFLSTSSSSHLSVHLSSFSYLYVAFLCTGTTPGSHCFENLARGTSAAVL